MGMYKSLYGKEHNITKMSDLNKAEKLVSRLSGITGKSKYDLYNELPEDIDGIAELVSRILEYYDINAYYEDDKIVIYDDIDPVIRIALSEVFKVKKELI